MFLDLDQIIENIDPTYSTYLKKQHFIVLDSVDSTNSYLLELLKNRNNEVIFCIANYQTMGRGRIGRQWKSPPGNIYLSILWKFNLEIQQLSGLNIVTAIAILQALHNYGAKDLNLKWPNDILYNNNKLAGILIENIPKKQNNCLAIIGIGVNLLPQENLSDKPIEFANLQNIIQKKPNRNIVISLIISKLIDLLYYFERNGLDLKLITEWEKYNYRSNKLIAIKTNRTIIEGINKGINQRGNLLLEPIKSNPCSIEHYTKQNLNPRYLDQNSSSNNFDIYRDFSNLTKSSKCLKLQVISSGEIELANQLD